MTISGNMTARRRETDVARTAAPPRMDDLVVSQSVDPRSLRRLLESLVQEDCVHSWRNFGPEGTLEQLLQWENARRPTKLFFFHSKHSGEAIAAAAIADRVTRDFPHAGFCVLGRCCIMPEFRSYGFYRHVLRYRLEYCQAEYGSALNAIHIGAVNDRISRVITNHELPGWPRFIHLGEEELNVAGEIRTIGAYLLLLPHYVQRMQRWLAGDHAPACVVELRNALSRMESGSIRNLGLLVKETYAEARAQRWFDNCPSPEIEQLLVFCRSIPLVGFS